MQELPSIWVQPYGEISQITPNFRSKNAGWLPAFDPLKLTRESPTSLPPTATELVLELLDPSGGVDEALFTRVDRVGIHSDVTNDFHVLNPIYRLCLTGFDRRHGEKLLPC